MGNIHTEENFSKLKRTCEKIISLTNENINGCLMATQFMFLGDNIKEFLENPIIENSGILENYKNKKVFKYTVFEDTSRNKKFFSNYIYELESNPIIPPNHKIIGHVETVEEAMELCESNWKTK